jgi:hypothetical protein
MELPDDRDGAVDPTDGLVSLDQIEWHPRPDALGDPDGAREVSSPDVLADKGVFLDSDATHGSGSLDVA